MRLPRPLLFALTASTLATTGCDKKAETANAPIAQTAPAPLASPTPSTPTPAVPTPASPTPATPTEPGPAGEPQLTALGPDEVIAIATFGDGKKITSDQVEVALAPLRANGSLSFPALRETVEDMVDDELLAAEALAASFEFEGDKTDRKALAEAWAKKSFLEKGREAVTDAELANWFSDRRGIARIWLRSADQAAEARKNLMDSFANAPDKKRDLFLELKRKVGGRPDPAPDGVLVDIEGKGELGDALVPVELAQAVFALKEDLTVSEPVASGGGFALVMRVGSRPATPLAQVPAIEVQSAKEKLAIKRANQLIDEHAARLRAEQKVALDAQAIARLGLKLGLGHGSHKKVPLSLRKIQLERLRNDIRGVPEVRDPGLVPAGAPQVERATYDKVREKMNKKPADQKGTP